MHLHACRPTDDAEFDHVPISDKITHRLLSDIKPSPKNDKLYKPIDPDDPDFRAFAESIRLAGCVREALFVTLDGYIASGHRRYAGAKLVGLETVPCRTVQIYHDDPRFLPLLCACNRQRVKSIDEVFREEILSVNPEEAYASLLQDRRQAAQIKVRPASSRASSAVQ